VLVTGCPNPVGVGKLISVAMACQPGFEVSCVDPVRPTSNLIFFQGLGADPIIGAANWKPAGKSPCSRNNGPVRSITRRGDMLFRRSPNPCATVPAWWTCWPERRHAVPGQVGVLPFILR